jgi:hypothetical protein
MEIRLPLKVDARPRKWNRRYPGLAVAFAFFGALSVSALFIFPRVAALKPYSDIVTALSGGLFLLLHGLSLIVEGHGMSGLGFIFALYPLRSVNEDSNPIEFVTGIVLNLLVGAAAFGWGAWTAYHQFIR